MRLDDPSFFEPQRWELIQAVVDCLDFTEEEAEQLDTRELLEMLEEDAAMSTFADSYSY